MLRDDCGRAFRLRARNHRASAVARVVGRKSIQPESSCVPMPLASIHCKRALTSESDGDTGAFVDRPAALSQRALLIVQG